MPVPVYLQSPALGSDGVGSLTELVDRIYQERGHMRNVTHESLQKEIEEDGAIVVDDSQSERNDLEPEEPSYEAQLKAVATAREELLGLVGEANNEVLMLQDFVSLLISKDATHAVSSISPALKELAPAGTFAFDRTPATQLDATVSEAAKGAAVELEYQNLNATADKILESASQLESEITKETRYWNEILSVTERGWSVTRTRGSIHTLGVRYSCLEAGPKYQARGQASLRSRADGGLTLDSGTSETTKSIMVSVVQGQDIIETSNLSGLLENEDAELESMIHQARDSLFDEELFADLSKEARGLLAYGIEIHSDRITISIGEQQSSRGMHGVVDDLSLQIELADRGPPVHGLDGIAEAATNFLRLGLNHEYRQRCSRRTGPPPAMSSVVDGEGSLGLLKGTICLVDHFYATRKVQDSVTHLHRTMQAAEVAFNIDTNRSFAPEQKASGKQRLAVGNKQLPRTDELYAVLLKPQTTTFTVSFANSPRIMFTIFTTFSGPQYGTTYTIEPAEPNSQYGFISMKFTEATQAIARLQMQIQILLIRHEAESLPEWQLSKYKSELVHNTKNATRLALRLTNCKLAVVLFDPSNGQDAQVLAVWDGERKQMQQSANANSVRVVIETAGFDTAD